MDRIENKSSQLPISDENLCGEGLKLTVKPIKKRQNKLKLENVTEVPENQEKLIYETGQDEKKTTLNVSDSEQKDPEQKSEGSSIFRNKRKALDNENDSEQQLKRGKQFKPYPFLEPNAEKRLLPDKEEFQNVPINIAPSMDVSLEKDKPPDNYSVNAEGEGGDIHSKDKTKNTIESNGEKGEDTNNPSKRRKKENDLTLKQNDQWMRGLKSKPRTQFKRKKDTVGYRINPINVRKSLINPSDFNFLSKDDSEEILDKWKPLSEIARKDFKNKRFKPYRSFSVYKSS